MNNTCRHTLQVIRAVVARYPDGLRTEDYAREMGVVVKRAAEILSRARRAEVIHKVGVPTQYRYFVGPPPEQCLKPRPPDIVQIVRPAADAPKLEVRGPRSVFDLGDLI